MNAHGREQLARMLLARRLRAMILSEEELEAVASAFSLSLTDEDKIREAFTRLTQRIAARMSPKPAKNMK